MKVTGRAGPRTGRGCARRAATGAVVVHASCRLVGAGAGGGGGSTPDAAHGPGRLTRSRARLSAAEARAAGLPHVSLHAQPQRRRAVMAAVPAAKDTSPEVDCAGGDAGAVPAMPSPV